MNDISQIEKFVTNEVVERWRDTSSATLLSGLGLKIRNQFEDFDVKTYGGLRAFCENISTIVIVQHPDSAQKIGAIPADVAHPDDLRDVFMSSPAAPAGPVYDDRFWKAFSTTVVDRRYIKILADGSFDVIESGEGGNGEVFEVLKEDIPDLPQTTPIPQKVDETHMKISNWLERNGLTDRVEVFKKGVKSSSNRIEGGGLNDLLKAFSRLNDDELRRISIPADVIAKLSGLN
ncbi:hypothetical protein [Rhodovulum sulfidophilum]|uniref:hypothetical protein n=1 Tax=Rhodovulum sulfidophilum TaxID=35806 RepID=UPI00117A9D52|nr:hypothetical protein [Rhodovulum sulfidophilum]MBL3554264.1 hypothetical protein [Rhodovulum sulfidophilum]